MEQGCGQGEHTSIIPCLRRCSGLLNLQLMSVLQAAQHPVLRRYVDLWPLERYLRSWFVPSLVERRRKRARVWARFSEKEFTPQPYSGVRTLAATSTHTSFTVCSLAAAWDAKAAASTCTHNIHFSTVSNSITSTQRSTSAGADDGERETCPPQWYDSAGKCT